MRFTSLIALLATALFACDAPTPTAAPDQAVTPSHATVASSSLRLDAAADGDGRVSIAVVYTRASEQSGPRQAELWVQLSPNLELVSAEAGDAALAADKQVLAQQREGHEVRVVAFGTTSLATLDSGVIARLHLRHTDDHDATVEFIERMPVFAPAGAQRGLRLPEAPTAIGRGGRE